MRLDLSNSTNTSPAFPVERRRDRLTRAMVDSKLMADEAEKLPEGPERNAAIAAVMRLAQTISEALDQKRAQEALARAGWPTEYSH